MASEVKNTHPTCMLGTVQGYPMLASAWHACNMCMYRACSKMVAIYLIEDVQMRISNTFKSQLIGCRY